MEIRDYVVSANGTATWETRPLVQRARDEDLSLFLEGFRECTFSGDLSLRR